MKKIIKFTIIALLISIITMIRCNAPDKNGIDRKTLIKIQQYSIAGKRLYQSHCLTCHGPEGKGVGELVPSLKDKAGSLFLDSKLSVCIIRHGTDILKKRDNPQPMPGNEKLTTLEIAEILTYVYNEMNDSTILITPSRVTTTLNECDDYSSGDK